MPETIENLQKKVAELDGRVASLEAKTPGWWETAYPWLTSKTAIAIYTAAATALMTWLSGVTTKTIEVPAEQPVEIKTSVDDVRRMIGGKQ